MKALDMEKAIKDYNELMFANCLEHCSIGTNFSEGTENWNLRDMVSEVQYHYECCYEEGNANSEGRYPDYWEIDEECLLSKRRYDWVVRHNESEKELHEYWLKTTRAYRGFLRKYSKYITDMKCVEGHCSKYD